MPEGNPQPGDVWRGLSGRFRVRVAGRLGDERVSFYYMRDRGRYPRGMGLAAFLMVYEFICAKGSRPVAARARQRS